MSKSNTKDDEMHKKSCKNQTNLFAILRCKIHLSKNNVGALTIVLNFHANKTKKNQVLSTSLKVYCPSQFDLITKS